MSKTLVVAAIGFLAAIGLLAASALLAGIGAQHSTSVAAEVRINAQRLDDGRTEFALQQRGSGAVWGDRLLPRGRYFPSSGSVDLWLNSTPLTLNRDLVVRITARLLDDGQIEFALQQRNEDGQWEERRLPRSRMFPVDARVGRWLSSSVLTLSVTQAPTENAMVSDEGGGSPDEPACRLADNADRVAAATFQVQSETSTGTAFYIGQDEWLTNHHVVDGLSQVLLVRADYSITANVIGSLPGYDLALLRAPAPYSVLPLSLASEEQPLGSNVSVLGFPPGVSGTPSLTRGVVSKSSPFSEFSGFVGVGSMVQIDAAINPGNSGGPMINDCGEVVGIATLKLFTTTDGRDVEGIGYGVAGETVHAQLPALRTTPHLGASARPSAPDRAQFEVASEGTYALGHWRHTWSEWGGWRTVVVAEGWSNHWLYDAGILALACAHDTDNMIVTLTARTDSFSWASLKSSEVTVGGFFGDGGQVDELVEFSTYSDYSRVSGTKAVDFVQIAKGRSTDRVGFLLPRWSEDIYVSFDLTGMFETPVQHLLELCVVE